MAEIRAMTVLPHMTYGIRMNADSRARDVRKTYEIRVFYVLTPDGDGPNPYELRVKYGWMQRISQMTYELRVKYG